MELETEQRALAMRQAELMEVQRRIDGLTRSIAAQLEATRHGLTPGAVAIEQAIWDRQYLTRLRRELHEAGTVRSRCLAAVELARRRLSAALQRVRVLEKHEERQRAAYHEENSRRDRREEDERNVLLYAHGHGGGAGDDAAVAAGEIAAP